MRYIHCLLIVLFFLNACTPSKQISRSARATVLSDSSLLTAHVGISIFDPAANKYLYNYQGDKYFVPASNTKIPTCYAAMKYLGDSLVGAIVNWTSDALHFLPTGDPTLLHTDFSKQPVLSLLQHQKKVVVYEFMPEDRFEKYGSGWTWNDYTASYMVERSRFPLYGNVFTFYRNGNQIESIPAGIIRLPYFREPMVQIMSINIGAKEGEFKARIDRARDKNQFRFLQSPTEFSRQQIPFITDDLSEDIQMKLLRDTLTKNISLDFMPDWDFNKSIKIHSQPTDSLLKPMMHRSDNFFAEQSLLMVSNEFLGVMNDAKIIDTILKTDFKDLPQKPRWADGSGLSRYNLFTPQDFVAILNKMKNEFGMDRIKEIFPTGGEGTLSSYYKSDSSFIYAKTGTLSGVVALSGFLYTKQNKLLIFSVLVNNHQSSATAVRRAVEKFIKNLREKKPL